MDCDPPVSPLLFVAAGTPRGADVPEIDDASEVVNVETDAVFGDPICGKVPMPLDESIPKDLPIPKEMTAAEFIRHCATHLPYNPACQYCVCGKKPNVHHRKSVKRRNIPLLCTDYAFLNDPISQDVTPFLVVYVMPWKLCVSTVVDTKGSNPDAIRRLAKWIRECGLRHLVVRSDR